MRALLLLAVLTVFSALSPTAQSSVEFTPSSNTFMPLASVGIHESHVQGSVGFYDMGRTEEEESAGQFSHPRAEPLPIDRILLLYDNGKEVRAEVGTFGPSGWAFSAQVDEFPEAIVVWTFAPRGLIPMLLDESHITYYHGALPAKPKSDVGTSIGNPEKGYCVVSENEVFVIRQWNADACHGHDSVDWVCNGVPGDGDGYAEESNPCGWADSYGGWTHTDATAARAEWQDLDEVPQRLSGNPSPMPASSTITFEIRQVSATNGWIYFEWGVESASGTHFINREVFGCVGGSVVACSEQDIHVSQSYSTSLLPTEWVITTGVVRGESGSPTICARVGNGVECASTPGGIDWDVQLEEVRWTYQRGTETLPFHDSSREEA